MDALMAKLDSLVVADSSLSNSALQRPTQKKNKNKTPSNCNNKPIPILDKNSAQHQHSPFTSTAPSSTKLKNSASIQQSYEFYICIDFEATCERDAAFEYPNEIIEFPAILLDGKTFEIVDTFHKYVKPSVNPTLSEFCVELTGISQATINDSDSFPNVLQEFEKWLLSHQLFYTRTCMLITDGPWDIRNFMVKQCCTSGIPIPVYCHYWINLRYLFTKFYNCERTNLSGMLEQLQLKFEGRQHAGLDDAKNVARIAKCMHEAGAVFCYNQWLGARDGIWTKKENKAPNRPTQNKKNRRRWKK